MREALNNAATTDDAVPLDLLQYSTDIACSMCVLLEALQVDMAKTGLIANQKCLASAGTELLRALGIIYEEVIPLCQSALTRLNREQHTTELGTFAQTRLLRVRDFSTRANDVAKRKILTMFVCGTCRRPGQWSLVPTTPQPAAWQHRLTSRRRLGLVSCSS
jgi:hypothetical protein